MEKKCKFCQKSFNAYRKTMEYCSKPCFFNDPNHPKNQKKPSSWLIKNCLNCGDEFTCRKSRNKILCSSKCQIEWNKKSDKQYVNTKKAIKEKYGVENVFQLDYIKDKIRNTNLERYGVDNPGKSEICREKGKKTNLLKYGVDSPFKSEIVKNKIIVTNRERYGVDYGLSHPDIRKKGSSTISKNTFIYLSKHYIDTINIEILKYNGPQTNNIVKCLSCGNVFETTQIGRNLYPNCKKCHPPRNDNNLTKKFETILSEIKINNYIQNDKFLLYPKEVDYVFENEKICVELNGNYWHSVIGGNKDRNYHIGKTTNLHNKKYKLIHIFEDEMINKFEIVKSRIYSIFNKTPNKIFARNCEIREIDNNVKETFLIKNHIQGNCVDKIRIGLYNKNELVCLMTFGKRKINGSKNSEWELLRFCNILYTTVIGGFSKLLKYFIKNYNPIKIITYADIRWSGYDPNKTVYLKNGFKFNGYSPPNYWYMDISHRFNRIHRFNFTKSKLIKEGFDPNKTEWEIMQEKKYDKIWDCGSMKFELIPTYLLE